MSGAMEIWGKKSNASSLQGLLVCSLINGKMGEAVGYAERLYSSFGDEFAKMVLGDNALATAENLWHDFLDAMQAECGSMELLGWIKNPQWKAYVGNRSIKPLVDKIAAAVEECKTSRGKSITVRYNAGRKLMSDTKADLSQLKALTAAEGVQYQMIADKVGLEILQCGIDYFNGFEAQDAARRAMTLQKYALSVVVGKMAKDRCKENVDILAGIIASLPPQEVQAEDRAIRDELQKFGNLPDEICHSVTLLNNTKPYLAKMKAQLGSTNSYYLKISTLVVDNALGNLIAEVNKAQDYPKELENYLRGLIINVIKGTLEEAWKATLIMDSFDMESDYRNGRYNKCRSDLKDLCDKFGVSTRTYSSPVSPRPSSAPSSSSARPASSSTSSRPVSPRSSSAPRSSSRDYSGLIFIICIIVGVVLFLHIIW